MLVMIFACEVKNNGIGLKGNLPWHYRDDMIFFKRHTANNYVICGRKTYDTLPKLPNRKVIVISSKNVEANYRNPIYACYNSIDEIARIAKESKEIYYVIGGASIYDQFRKYADELCITEIIPKGNYVYETDAKVFDYKKDFLCISTYTVYDQNDTMNEGVVSNLKFSIWRKKKE